MIARVFFVLIALAWLSQFVSWTEKGWTIVWVLSSTGLAIIIWDIKQHIVTRKGEQHEGHVQSS